MALIVGAIGVSTAMHSASAAENGHHRDAEEFRRALPVIRNYLIQTALLWLMWRYP